MNNCSQQKYVGLVELSFVFFSYILALMPHEVVLEAAEMKTATHLHISFIMKDEPRESRLQRKQLLPGVTT